MLFLCCYELTVCKLCDPLVSDVQLKVGSKKLPTNSFLFIHIYLPLLHCQHVYLETIILSQLYAETITHLLQLLFWDIMLVLPIMTGLQNEPSPQC